MGKLKILINAYACSPERGSEPGMGWNWCTFLAKHCELFIISDDEFRDKIESTLATLPQGGNMHFYYNHVSEKVRKIAWNQGDWRFYWHYRKWQKKTLEIAKEIVSKHNIDILHQLNMIGFREPGYLWKINDIPFVWGPIGGLKQFPVAYLQGANIKFKLFNRLKNCINLLQLKYDNRVDKAFKRTDLIISSIPDSYNAIKKYKKKESVLIPETGTFDTNDIQTKRFDDEDFQVMWVGKFDFRKQLPLALKTLAATNNKRIILNIYGQGSESQEEEMKQLVVKLNIYDQVIWHGNQPFLTVQNAMCKAHLFFFTSVSEDTSTVILEAISNRLPVLCFDTCGFGAVINNMVGCKIPLSNPKKSITDFATHLNMLYANRSMLYSFSLNCKELQQKLSWDVKAIKMAGLYEKLVSPNC